jgi:DNA polymerase-3 subunit epsilon
MVQYAPRFEDIARELYYLLNDKIFVAHNVNFDYSFIKNSLQTYGYTLNAKKLCTIRLARQAFPGLRSYGLGNLCRSLDIEIINRHRAGGDAAATAILFKKILQQDINIVETSLKKPSKEQTLPPNVPKEHFTNLPYGPGVYYFHDSKGKIVYVGKAKNIKWRVNSHFSNNSSAKQKQNFVRHVFAISFQQTATELMAAILESTEIKRLWPQFNFSQKGPEDTYGIFMYEDQNGYMRLAIEKKRINSNPVYTFHYKVDGHGVLRKLLKEFGLCPKLCFIQTDNEKCQGLMEQYCTGACEKNEQPSVYNERVFGAVACLTKRPSYVVLDRGLTDEDLSCIMVLKGSFFGMGYLPKDFNDISEKAIAPYIKSYKENSFIKTLLGTFINKYPEGVRVLADLTPNPMPHPPT